MLMDTLKMLDGAAVEKDTGGKYVGAAVYDIAGSTLSALVADAVLMRFVANRAFALPAGLAESAGSGAVVPTAAVTYSIKKNGVEVGTMNFALGASTATFTMASETTFAIGDILTVHAPASLDATHADLQWTLAANLI